MNRLLLLLSLPGFARAHQCTCSEFWALCPNGEESKTGCNNDPNDRTFKTCADLCPGDLPWKNLYRESIEKMAAIEVKIKNDFYI